MDCIIYGTGFRGRADPAVPPGRPRHRGSWCGVTLAEKWADGAASLFGMMSRGFPNLFVMPAPGQQAVVTVNYTQLAVLGAEFIARTVEPARSSRMWPEFDVSDEAEEAWTEKIVASFVDPSSHHVRLHPVPASISRAIPETMNPRNGNYGRGLGDWFGYRDLLEQWLDAWRPWTVSS